MKLEKNKVYAIACLGPYDYNRYAGKGVFTGNFEESEEEIIYEFKIDSNQEFAYFSMEDVIGELK